MAQRAKPMCLFIFVLTGEIIESGLDPKFLGNYFSFMFLKLTVHSRISIYEMQHLLKVNIKPGVQCGIAGQTGYSKGIHLHLECLRGRKTSVKQNIFV